ncbi:hypothetical protein AVEN_17415-1 [Araneus ventricosus]|uniref:Uncharacterized protein n=1 Tax=Araneus ventricosus TaxID=182803 RepID=A0A4Y2H117_ARAVE|nr:hypothetical protein AVEN_17415-1 [Araneus ventricosus]
MPSEYSNPILLSLSSFLSPKKEKHNCASFLIIFCQQEEECFPLQCGDVFMWYACAETIYVCFPHPTAEMCQLIGPKHVTWAKEQWRSVLFRDEPRFTLKNDSAMKKIRNQVQPV